MSERRRLTDVFLAQIVTEATDLGANYAPTLSAKYNAPSRTVQGWVAKAVSRGLAPRLGHGKRLGIQVCPTCDGRGRIERAA